MDKVRPVDLQAAFKFVQLDLKFVLDLGRFARFIADMNVHACLGSKRIPKEASDGPHSIRILHLQLGEESGFSLRDGYFYGHPGVWMRPKPNTSPRSH
jgi:hypothetical protein